MPSAAAASLAALLLGATALGQGGAAPATPGPVAPGPAKALSASEYVVQPGDTCASIAKKVLGDERAYAQIHQLNGMGPPPHNLKPGTVLKVRDDSPDARLTFVKPDVNAKRAAAPEWQPATSGEPLFKLDQVNTLRRAGAEVTFRDLTSLQLRENALIVIYGTTTGADALRKSDKSGAVALVQGELRLRLAQLRGEAVGVDTPAAKVSATSKDLHVGVDEAKMSRVAVYQGKAEVAALGKQVAVAEGQGTRVEKGKVPEAPRPLPAAPGWPSAEPLLALALPGEPTSAQLAWKPVERAAKYRVEVSEDETFNGLAVDETVDAAGGPKLATAELAPGRYYARVQALDADGLLGRASAVKPLEVARLKLEKGERSPAGVEGEREVRLAVESPSGLGVIVDGTPGTWPVSLAEVGAHEVRISAKGALSGVTVPVLVRAPPPPPPPPVVVVKVEPPPPPPPARVSLGSLMGTPFTPLERPVLEGALRVPEPLAEARAQVDSGADGVRLRVGASVQHGFDEHLAAGVSFQGRAPLANVADSPSESTGSVALHGRYLVTKPDAALIAGVALDGVAGQTAERSAIEVLLRPALLLGVRGDVFAVSTTQAFGALLTAGTPSWESAYQLAYLPAPWLVVSAEVQAFLPFTPGGQVAVGGAVGARCRLGALEVGAAVRGGLFSPQDRRVWDGLGGQLTLGWHP